MSRIYYLIPITLLFLILIYGCVSQQVTSTNATQQATQGVAQEASQITEEMAYQSLIEELNKLQVNTTEIEQQLFV
ncbi:MAG: hypothetical protein OH319_04605 [Candidatus Parvarchaeota archaeon]|nr:hypothetical protein [Candidatus Jingweiarchaeum tengchongense]MCW1298663.1 hypothetical protein [Candidatus Jingweiarchaeum tengchongense]MCW1300505.1 hypothetical protein [Candidatus Jingweiarchaeum tengchongense]MCW1304680.1 hypothetical protein [Candidatus Jingweiarchaeum tengchongense]MCW1305869.1 hypothetical protein [Candidatus Jingweiarchaeum tengchongense]